MVGGGQLSRKLTCAWGFGAKKWLRVCPIPLQTRGESFTRFASVIHSLSRRYAALAELIILYETLVTFKYCCNLCGYLVHILQYMKYELRDFYMRLLALDFCAGVSRV
jgi:hypothetical protein